MLELTRQGLEEAVAQMPSPHSSAGVTPVPQGTSRAKAAVPGPRSQVQPGLPASQQAGGKGEKETRLPLSFQTLSWKLCARLPLP